MCGIAGFTLPAGLGTETRIERFGSRLRRMTASLYHRGPDAQRALLLDGVALGHARLAIVDPAGGAQPMSDPDTGVTVVFNGEIFNHVELREQLRTRYRFRTRCDTEVILAAFQARGIGCVQGFIGQFAFAVWDPRDRSLWLVRDRVGVRPLYYCVTGEGLAFASEAKAIFAAGWIRARLDPLALKETLQLWSPVPPRSAFTQVMSLPPGTVACWRGGAMTTRRYWDLDLDEQRIDGSISADAAEARLEALLADAIRIRLRADVPVAAYLSGGVDSSLVCAMAQSLLRGSLQTFSVAFEQPQYDESTFQSEVALALRTRHHATTIGDAQIGELLPAAVAQAEQVLLRTAPAPLLKLSALARDRGAKVVLTGEGADEIFWGYDIFRETAVRQFWARQPRSRIRPRLLSRLHPSLALGAQSTAMLEQFYGAGLAEISAPDSSHRLRWAASARVGRFLAPGFAEPMRHHDPARALAATLPAAFARWRPLARAQYLEMQTLLSGYLLSAQGDRMLMANSVEGRFPFLDHRLIEFAARLPAQLKLRGGREKYILRRLARRLLPERVVERAKFPYRAPGAEALVGPSAPPWSRELLGAPALERTGIFDGGKVSALVARLERRTAAPSEADNAALVAVATTQLLAQRFGAEPAIDRGRVEAVAWAGAAVACAA